MIAWRLVKARYADVPLSMSGAVAEGGRWNAPGTPLLYCSEHLSLAALEVLVHLAPDYRSIRFVALELEIPGDARITRWDADRLPKHWKTLAGNTDCQERGTQWARSGDSLVLSVPSVIVSRERNILLNGRHAAFEHVRVRSREPFTFDPGL